MKTVHIKVQTDDSSQIDSLKAFMKALKIKFEVSKEKPYDPAFVEKILQGDRDYKAGKGRKTSVKALNALWK
jgi:hypothetical protein